MIEVYATMVSSHMIYTAATHVIFTCSVNVADGQNAIFVSPYTKIHQRECENSRLPSRMCVLAMMKYCA